MEKLSISVSLSCLSWYARGLVVRGFVRRLGIPDLFASGYVSFDRQCYPGYSTALDKFHTSSLRAEASRVETKRSTEVAV